MKSRKNGRDCRSRETEAGKKITSTSTYLLSLWVSMSQLPSVMDWRFENKIPKVTFISHGKISLENLEIYALSFYRSQNILGWSKVQFLYWYKSFWMGTEIKFNFGFGFGPKYLDRHKTIWVL